SSYGILDSQVVGVLEFSSPAGNFHVNSNFNFPDITLGLGNTFTTNLPTGAPKGNYSVKYTIQVSWVDEILGVNQGNNFFSIGGDRTESYPAGKQFIVNGGANQGIYFVHPIGSTYISSLNVTIVPVVGS